MSITISAERLHQIGKSYMFEDNILARKFLQKASDLGSDEAKFDLVQILDNEEFQLSIELLLSLVENKYGPACIYFLEHFYYQVDDELIDRDEIFENVKFWYEVYAATDDAEKLLEYGEFLIRENDLEYGYEILLRAAEFHNSRACWLIGRLNLLKKIEHASVSAGVTWLRKAGELNYPSGYKTLGDFYLNGFLDDPISKKINIQIEPDVNEAIKCYEAAIEKGVRTLAFTLYKIYIKGEVIPKNNELAEKWLLKGAILGDTGAIIYLANEYLRGENFKKNIHSAIYWFRSLGDDNVRACLELSKIFSNEMIYIKDLNESFNWFRKATMGDGFLKNISDCLKYLNENLSKEDIAVFNNEACVMFEQAKKRALDYQFKKYETFNPYSELGEHFELGLGIAIDIPEAIKWYSMAEKQGCFKSKNKLKLLTNS